ncbi:transforming growth factor beta activator LRRC32 [Rhinichthys klamathensis goyatoka]|uniref:transforming growth factor beta activator LRRC32 n=1 Tax=Rhinichthys klamathensis goyatoka TaxID=3034132 RepID=UPI0024B5E8F0|nr:transforming growth factor beta activator LRRC32 [Rhinichthys klamathensis goyatoka]
MGPCLWILVLVVQPVLAFRRPAQASACRQIQEDLDCSNLNLRRIPKQIPDTIHRLDLSRNLLQNLTDRDLPSSSTIRHLNLHGNKIQFIQPGLFQDMSLLEELDLSENSLDLYASLKTHVGTLTSVRRLDLSGNGLFTDMSDFFLNDAPVLTNLSLDGNSITKIGRSTFNGSQALKNIDLNNNVIIEIEEGAFEFLTGLSNLDLSMNSISCITDFNLVQLKTLNLSKNSLTNFQADDSDQEFELQYLDLRENKILYFPVLPQRNKLIYLDLSRNLLRSVNCSGPLEELENLKDSGYLMTDPDKPLSLCVNKRHQDFPSLLYLDLSFNQLKAVPPSFFTSMTALETLNISNNCLESFIVDDGLNSLETLDISSNNLQNLSFGLNALAALHELRLGGNALQTLDAGVFLRLPSIRSLHLQQNQLSICSPLENPSFGCVQLSSIPTLRYLYLSENGLFSVPPGSFQGSPLLILDLSQNPGVDVIPASFSGLEASLSHLSLKGNQLQSLTIDFTLFPNLKSLDLSVNRLTGVSLWSGDSSLESLNLQNNSLVTLHEVTLQETLRTLYVGSNPLSCCMNPHLLTLLRQERLTVPDLSGATCWYSRDSESVEISVSAVQPEHCESADGKVLWISVIVVLVLGMALVLAVTLKLCHSKRHRFKRGFKA